MMITIDANCYDFELEKIIINNPDFKFIGDKDFMKRIEEIKEKIKIKEHHNKTKDDLPKVSCINYGIEDGQLYSMRFKDGNNNEFYVKNIEILNFAPASNSAFKNEYGLFIIPTCNVIELIPKIFKL